MARIAGIELEDKWTVAYALTKIKGIGWSLSEKILEEVGIDKGSRLSNLKTDDIVKISSALEKYEIEGDLIRKVRSNITRLRNTSSYKGSRHSKGLPARGQRTRHNARQKRGKRKTVGAFRKEALTKLQQAQKDK